MPTRIVVARGAVRLKFLDLSALPASEQVHAARQQGLAWEPFEDAEVQFFLAPGRAILFAWSRAGLGAWARERGIDLQRCKRIPETLLCAPPSAGLSARLVRVLDGVEAQCWRGGSLQASRWWPAAPDLQSWQHFMRSSGLPELSAAAEHLPEIMQPQWRARPWATLRPVDAAPGKVSRAEGLLIAGLALVGIAAAAGQAREAWEQHLLDQSLQTERVALQTELAPLLAGRGRALEMAASARQWAARLDTADPLGVMLHLARVLPPDGVRLKELIVEGRNGRVVLEATSSVSRAALVSALQTGGLFTQVAETSEGVQQGWVGFSFVIESLDLAPLSAAAPAAGPGSGPRP